MSDGLERLRAEIQQTESVIDSAITFVNGVANRIRTALMSSDSDTELSNLADELDAHSEKLATAIAENTGAAEDSDTVYDPAPIDGSTEVAGDTTGSDTTAQLGGADDGSTGEASSPESGDSSAVPADQGTASDSTSSDQTDDSTTSDTAGEGEDEVVADVAESVGDTSGLPNAEQVVETNNNNLGDSESTSTDTPSAA